MADLIGRFLGSYEILGEIGRGGMATVYRAKQSSIGREVAVKVLHRSLIEQDATFLDRFDREVQVVASLQHPHILPVYDYGECDGQPYIVMAYLTGGTLADYIHEQSQMRLPEVARLVRQVADALDYAHGQGIIHRDFKPSNVLMDEPGNAYLADFGLAKVVQDSRLSVSGVAGTPDYMAPDWAQEKSVTPAVDVYALGVALYQMLTGEVPYHASSPMGVLMAHMNEPIPDVRAIRPDLPDMLQEVISKAMAKSPTERFASAGDIAAGLDMATGGWRASSEITPPSGVEEALSFPAAHLRFNLLAAEDLLGEDALNGVLLVAGMENLIGNYPPDGDMQPYPSRLLTRLWRAIYEVYGLRGLKTVARLAGQRVAHLSITSEHGRVMRQAAEAVVKVLPLESAVSKGLSILARFFSDELVTTEETDLCWVWRVGRCANCLQWRADEPICYSWVGYLQGELAWLSNGRKFRIVETECRAMGHEACVFQVDKKPVGE